MPLISELFEFLGVLRHADVTLTVMVLLSNVF